MSILVFAATAVAGGVGAALRYYLDGRMSARTRHSFPYGTAVINISGCLCIGVVTGLAAASVLPAPLVAVLGVGLLGGYTTFSTASVETVRLVQQHRYRAALLNSLGVLVSSLVAALVGFWLTSAW